ncbi:NitT/TauT family transport system substrate-binding protein [Rhodobacter sp. JA431]|uniref:ABC transporter substrate-binding protein n=1 Tax=Rhodobacter sp. JA431 TaxID=570013 RepID=UPI000BCD166C|nr:ABC transporter substrate-binding protein [Rhodobacter sp. JA431]SOC20034.1 NitT/TauT family transport system substrate-binding protein [Rhodobacter sp. JA431]
MFHRLGLCAALLLTASPLAAETAMPFALDWKFEGPAAPYVLAADKGYYAAEGLDVTVTEGAGSLDAIPKVATGAYPVGFTDINSLMKFLDQNPGAPVKAIMMIYDKPPFAVVGRKSLGVEAPADLEGKVLGAPPPDGAWAQFPIFAAENGLDMSKITVEPVGFPVREPMLAEGKVAAITGFSFTSTLNAERLGVPADDVSLILMADYGVALYGNAIIVNTDFAADHPAEVTGFLRATAMGWKDAIADPAAAVEALVGKNPAADASLEERRLGLAISGNVLTDYVKEHGLGGVDAERFAKAIDQLSTTYEFTTKPSMGDIFDASFLPTDGSLNLQ